MPERKTIQAYLETVAEQLRWERARPVVTLELRRHLEDQRDAFADEGNSPEEAERLAVEEMGDPVTVGTELDRIHRPKPQWGLLLLTVALAVAGALLRVLLERAGIFSHIDAADPVRTVAALLLGSACLLGVYFLDYTWLVRYAGMTYAGILLLLLAAVSPLLTPHYAGGRIHYIGFHLVLLCPAAYAVWLCFCRLKGWPGVFLALLGGVPLAAFAVLVPTTGGLLTLLLTGFVLMLCAAGVDWFGVGKKKTAGVTLGLTAALAAYVIWQGGQSLVRELTIAFHPELDADGVGFLAASVKASLKSSRLLGSADLGPLSPDDLGVPSWPQDFLLSEMIYKLGWLPFLVLAAVIAVMLVWLFRRCLRQRNQAGRLIALAVAMTLSIQTAFSFLANLGCLLLGACMPLLGGNLHMVLDMTLIGLALSVFRSDSIARMGSPKSTERRRSAWPAAPFRNI